MFDRRAENAPDDVTGRRFASVRGAPHTPLLGPRPSQSVAAPGATARSTRPVLGGRRPLRSNPGLLNRLREPAPVRTETSPRGTPLPSPTARIAHQKPVALPLVLSPPQGLRGFATIVRGVMYEEVQYCGIRCLHKSLGIGRDAPGRCMRDPDG